LGFNLKNKRLLDGLAVGVFPQRHIMHPGPAVLDRPALADSSEQGLGVSLNEAGHPMHARITAVSGFSSEAIAEWAKQHLAAGSQVLSDGEKKACCAKKPAGN